MMNSKYIRTFLLFVLLFLNFSLFSQSFKAYIHGGVIASQIDGDEHGGYNKPGIFGGVAVSFPLKNDNDLMLEMNYIELGARKNPDLDAGDYTKYVLRTNYIQVPVLYRYNLHRNLSLDGGFSFSTLIHTKQFDSSGPIDVSGSEIKPFNVGAIFGFDLRMNSNWSVLLRWSYSVLPFRDHSSGASFRLNMGQYHNYINTSLQYGF